MQEKNQTPGKIIKIPQTNKNLKINKDFNFLLTTFTFSEKAENFTIYSYHQYKTNEGRTHM